MNKTFALKLAGAGLALLAGSALFLRSPDSSRTSAPAVNPAPSPAVSAQPQPRPAVPRPPDLPTLMARLGNGGGVPPTPEQLAEQKRMVDGQVADAVALLDSGDTARKVEAAEQLAAYPTQESERRLARALAEEKAPEVRIAAARALAQVANPERASVAALLRALSAPQAEVHEAALQALAGYLNRLDSSAARFREIRAGLAKFAKSKPLDPERRRAVRELLARLPG
jgi:hypothetical protein